MSHNAKFLRRRFGTTTLVVVTLLFTALLVTGIVLLA